MKNIKVLLAIVLITLINACSSDSTEPEIIKEDINNISIQNGSITLKGKLYLPTAEGPYPVIIIVPGSGQITRDDSQSAVELFKPFGFAVFNYDKRGVGESTGNYEPVTIENSIRIFDDLSSDVLAIVNYLKTRNDIDKSQIGVIGSSQGGWISPLAASKSSDIKYMISLSGAASTIGISEYFDGLTDEGKTIEEANQLLDSYSGEHGFNPSLIYHH